MCDESLTNQVCQLVRKRFKREAIPIIMLSAKNTSEDVARGLELGANDYVKKPFDRKELISRINVQLRNR
jgi:DNA-binding response OmpR family regulator